ncbi:MAG: TlpA disulfide reductase family protein [Planctomycetota bacterium]
MTSRFKTMLTACLLCLAGQTVAAPPNTGRMPDDRLIDAHREMNRVQATTDYTLFFSRVDETDFLQHTYRIVFDRSSNRLRIERPGFTVVCDGEHLTLVSPTIGDKYLRAPLTGALTLEKLVGLVPDLADPLPVELVLLLADKPAPIFSAGRAENLTLLQPDPRDPGQRMRLQTVTPRGTLTLFANRVDWRLNEAVVVATDRQLTGTGMSDARYHYQVRWDAINQPIDDGVFTLDTTGRTEVGTMRELLAVPSAPRGGGGPTLIGKELPDIELAPLTGGDPVSLKTIADQSAAASRLLVVEFYANWSRPSVLDLPTLVRFKDWGEANDKPIDIVLVAVMQPADKTRQWLDLLEEQAEVEVDLPVLLDPEGATTQALMLPGIPRTMVVKDGKIVDVLGGYKPEFEADLQRRAEQFLASEE